MLICLDGQRPWSAASALTRLTTKIYNSCRCVAGAGLRFALIVFFAVGAYAQSTPQTLGIPAPTTTGVLGHTDAAALSEIVAHLKTVGAAPWAGMVGTGQITYGSDSTSYPATLTIQGSTRFRLDGQTSAGTLSIRINGRIGKIQEADGRVFPILPDTASTGIFQFQLLRLADFPQPSSSLIDHGESALDGAMLHRVTFERPMAVTAKSSPQNQKTIATDLYFDPNTHLLAKSVNSIQIDEAGSSRFLRVITYEDYRQINGMMIPFRFIQTLDSQKQWALQLSEVQLGSNQPSTFFQF